MLHPRRTVPRRGPDSHSLGHLYAKKYTGYHNGKKGGGRFPVRGERKCFVYSTVTFCSSLRDTSQRRDAATPKCKQRALIVVATLRNSGTYLWWRRKRGARTYRRGYSFVLLCGTNYIIKAQLINHQIHNK